MWLFEDKTCFHHSSQVIGRLKMCEKFSVSRGEDLSISKKLTWTWTNSARNHQLQIQHLGIVCHVFVAECKLPSFSVPGKSTQSSGKKRKTNKQSTLRCLPHLPLQLPGTQKPSTKWKPMTSRRRKWLSESMSTLKQTRWWIPITLSSKM